MCPLAGIQLSQAAENRAAADGAPCALHCCCTTAQKAQIHVWASRQAPRPPRHLSIPKQLGSTAGVCCPHPPPPPRICPCPATSAEALRICLAAPPSPVPHTCPGRCASAKPLCVCHITLTRPLPLLSAGPETDGARPRGHGEGRCCA